MVMMGGPEMESADERKAKTIIRSPRGAGRHTVPLNEVQVPDLWHVASYLHDQGHDEASNAVLETWHLAHDLLANLREEV